MTPAEVEKLKNKLKPKTSAQIKEGKRKGIVKHVKENIVCADTDIREKLYEWIDVMSEQGKPLSDKIVDVFFNGIKEFAEDNKNIIILLIQKAISNSYADYAYAINAYRTEMKNKKMDTSGKYRRATSVGGNNF